MRQRLAAHPAYRPTHLGAQRPGQRRGQRRLSRSPRNILGPDLDQLADYSLQGARGGAEAAEHRRGEDSAQRVEPGDPRRRRPQARRRSRRPHGDGRQHAAAGRRRRRPDLELPRRRRSATRSRSACSRTSGATSSRSAGSPCRRRPGRCASTTSPRLERGLGPSALQRSNRQFTVSLQRRHGARPRARRGVERHPQDVRRA